MKSAGSISLDQDTADAFAASWNDLPVGPVYTYEQFADWMAPITVKDVTAKDVLEMGCGNGSLMYHAAGWEPRHILGIDLGGSVKAAANTMRQSGFKNWEIKKADLLTFDGNGFDLVYCIGVIHHLKDPESGYKAVVRNTQKGGRLH